MKLLFLHAITLASAASAFTPSSGLLSSATSLNTKQLHATTATSSVSTPPQQRQRQSSPNSNSNDATTTTTIDGNKSTIQKIIAKIHQITLSPILLSTTLLLLFSLHPTPALAITSETLGASSAANTKIATGGASTLQSGRTIAVTRGINLDRSDFSNQNLKGVAFQQSIVRDSNFKGSNLVGSSFFDATVDGSDFEGADMTLANVEMAQFNRANLKNTVVREMYVSGSTLFEGVKNIEGSDWSDTFLRADQKKYLCGHPTAKGTNPQTGVDTRESLMCP